MMGMLWFVLGTGSAVSVAAEQEADSIIDETRPGMTSLLILKHMDGTRAESAFHILAGN